MNIPSKRMQNLTFEKGIRDIQDIANELKKQGKKIINLEIGQPDFTSPKVAVDALNRAIKDEKFQYCDLRGIEELRIAIAKNAKKEIGLDVDQETEVLVGVGSMSILSATMIALLDAEDEIIVVTPCFPPYFDMAYFAGAVPIEFPLKAEENYRINSEELEKLVTDKTRMILINTPNNPTGYVMTKTDLESVASVAINNDLIVLSDEAYSRYIYEGEHISIATLPNMRERTVIANTTSKMYSMTGWRVGYGIAPKNMMKYISRTHYNIVTGPTTFAQYGAVAAYEHGDGHFNMMAKEFGRRRELIYKHLDAINRMDYVKTGGAFYVFPCIDKFNLSSQEFCDYILREAGVAIVPGDNFKGEKGKNFVRIAYSNTYENIDKAMTRIREALEKI